MVETEVSAGSGRRVRASRHAMPQSRLALVAPRLPEMLDVRGLVSPLS